MCINLNYLSYLFDHVGDYYDANGDVLLAGIRGTTKRSLAWQDSRSKTKLQKYGICVYVSSLSTFQLIILFVCLHPSLPLYIYHHPNFRPCISHFCPYISLFLTSVRKSISSSCLCICRQIAAGYFTTSTTLTSLRPL